MRANETETALILRSIRNAARVMRNAAARKVLEMESRGAPLEELLTVVGGQIGRKALLEGDTEEGTFAVGQAIGLIHEIKSIAEVIDDIVQGAGLVYNRLGKILNQTP